MCKFPSYEWKCYAPPVSRISKTDDPEDIFVMDVDCYSPATRGLDSNGQKLHVDGEDCGKLSNYDEACVVFENSHVTVNTIESELPYENKDEESPLSGSKWTATDESIALWVKWRGKWQAGIKCERADWPLDTVKARPTHDRKSYIVIFFPHTRNYSWVDTFLVRPIDDLQDPIVHKSYEIGFQLVQDLSIARRFIMQKLAVGVLNIFDRLHFQVLMPTARDIVVWKEFALEVPRCKGYSELGGMLVRLQKMVLEQYIDGNWLKDSFNSWANQCQNALTAESVELLLEELVSSVLWKEISAVQDVQGFPANGAEWKMWKHEVLKSFSTSHPISIGTELEQPNKTIIELQRGDNPFSMSYQVSRKRPKLEVRRAETHSVQAENKGQHEDAIAEIDSEYFIRQSTEVVEYGSLADQKGDSSSDNLNVNGLAEANPVISGTKSRKCKAYIEAKGRQCVRWANEGDEYCCVHLAARFTGNTVKPVVQTVIDAPLCGGTTTLGTKCKHRALPGSSFCKKHGPRDVVGTKVRPSPPRHHFKRKDGDLGNIPGNTCSMDLVLAEESEQPLQVEPLSMRVVHNGRSRLVQVPEHFKDDYNRADRLCCVGLGFCDEIPSCSESPTRHSLYCDNHIPSWLKRARNGKSRIISKEVFMDLLRGCSSRDQKVHLHQACELFYKLFKSVLSMRNQVPREIQFQWVLSEASKDPQVATFFMRLVSCEKARIRRIWGFGSDEDNQPSRILATQEEDQGGSFKCKLCTEDFTDDQELGAHWIESHNKEAQWYFRGYACSVCLDSFTNRKVLETHVQDRHHAQFSDHCMLYRCIPCGGHFGNSEELWSHVLSSHTDGFRQSMKSVEQHKLLDGEDLSIQDPPKAVATESNSENQGTVRKYICRFCGLKFDLLPDLGRHHQAAHMRPTLSSSRHPKGIRFYSYRLKSGRLTRPKFKKGLGGVPYILKSKVAAGLKKGLQASKSIGPTGVNPQHLVTVAKGLGRLAETECLDIAKKLYCEAQKTRARPNNLEILNIARSSCCKVSLQASLEEKYGVLPKRLYLRAAKLCGEHNARVNWHQEGFGCPKGCKPRNNDNTLSVLTPLSSDHVASMFVPLVSGGMEQWEKDESHYIINSNNLRHNHFQTTIILCDDISFGKEAVPIACIIDKNMLDSLHVPTYGFNGQVTYLPWESFRYVVRPLVDPSLGVDTQCLRLGCSQSTCSPETCDQVYLFNTDYEDAKDMYGKSVTGRFPYDENGKIILEEGYMVYECNHLCKCSKSCPNRILQNGVQAKLEVFKTLKKGWALRAGDSISRGTFICEFIGEVIDEQEANRRSKRYGKQYCDYIYNLGSCVNKMAQLIEEKVSCVIDTSKIGNIARYVNHSCSPNLVSRPVLVESMDYELAHIGLYANRDIAVGEELTFDYGKESQHEEGSSCFCGSSRCRGRLF